MTTNETRGSPVEPNVSLDGDRFLELGLETVEKQLQDFARSTQIEIDQEELRLTLCGTNLEHHNADPYLNQTNSTLLSILNKNQYGEYRKKKPNYDLCMEDSWSGFFIAQCISTWKKPDPIILLHLDDHTDMMDTLLLSTSEGLIDPGYNQLFNPAIPSHWLSAIQSGAIGIGSFVTALYYLPNVLHVLHLNHNPQRDYQIYSIAKRLAHHPLLPHAQFASIEKHDKAIENHLGTYKNSIDPEKLLQQIPNGRVIVHIDLDYFINDYNGNLGQTPELDIDAFQSRAEDRMDKFFNALADTNIAIERWIIATSPGFCSARHWDWILASLSERIKNINTLIQQNQQ